MFFFVAVQCMVPGNSKRGRSALLGSELTAFKTVRQQELQEVKTFMVPRIKYIQESVEFKCGSSGPSKEGPFLAERFFPPRA